MELESVLQAINILTNSGKLKNSGIWVQKDYTLEERNKRFHLRELRKYIRRVSKKTKCVFKYTSLLVGNKSYEWCNGDIVAQNEEDKRAIMQLLAANSNHKIVVKKNSPVAASTSNSGNMIISD